MYVICVERDVVVVRVVCVTFDVCRIVRLWLLCCMRCVRRKCYALSVLRML